MKITKPVFPKRQEKRLDEAGNGRLPYHYIKLALAAVLLIFIILDMANDPVSTADIGTVAEQVVKAAQFQGMEGAAARMEKRF